MEAAKILLKSDSKSLQKFLSGRTNNLKLDRCSLELQGRRIQYEHIPGAQNKAADCLSKLPFVTQKRNDNPLHDNPDSTQVHHITEDDMNPECRLCEVNFTETITLQQDKHCIRIQNLMKDKNSKFSDRDRCAVVKGLLCHKNLDKGKEYQTIVIPKVLVPTILKEMHDKFGHFGIGKTYSLIKRYYFWPKMIKHIQRHVQSCSLCRREKLVTDKYQLQTTEIPHQPFAKVSVDLKVDLPVSHKGTKNILVVVDH